MNREMAEIVRDRTPVMMRPTDTMQSACGQMHQNRVGYVLVTAESGSVLGIFTGRDAVRALADGKDAAGTPLHDVMTKQPATLPPTAKAIDALRLMHDGGFRHVPVVLEECVLGVASEYDFRDPERDRLEEETGVWQHMR
jgi:CBS domain-containing protein